MTFYEKTLEVSWWMLCLGRSRSQNPRGLRPLGFWPWDLPRHNIHHGTSSAFLNNVPLSGAARWFCREPVLGRHSGDTLPQRLLNSVEGHFAEDTLTVDSGQWTVDSGQWTVDSGQWTVDNGQWTVDSGQWTVDSGQWTVDSGQRAI